MSKKLTPSKKSQNITSMTFSSWLWSGSGKTNVICLQLSRTHIPSLILIKVGIVIDGSQAGDSRIKQIKKGSKIEVLSLISWSVNLDWILKQLLWQRQVPCASHGVWRDSGMKSNDLWIHFCQSECCQWLLKFKTRPNRRRLIDNLKFWICKNWSLTQCDDA